MCTMAFCPFTMANVRCAVISSPKINKKNIEQFQPNYHNIMNYQILNRYFFFVAIDANII